MDVQPLLCIPLWRQRAQGPGPGVGTIPRAWPFHSRAFGFKGISSIFFLSAALPGWAELGYTSGNTPPHAGQELPGPAGLDAASRLQQFIPEICIHEALLS